MPANSVFTELVVTTHRTHSKGFKDNLSNSNFLYGRIRKKGNYKKIAGGTSIVEPLDYAANQTYQRFSDWDIVDIRASDVLSAAEYQWKQIAMHVVASERELLVNSGDAQLEDLVAARMKNAYRTFANNFSSDMYSSGSLSNQIGGLQHLIADTPTGTVGGIDANVWSFWQNTVFDLSDNSVTMSASTIENSVLLPMWVSVGRGMNDQPDLLVMSSEWYQLFEASQTSIKRYASAQEASAGFVTLKYKNADVIYDTSDSGVPATHIYMINTDYVKLKVHENADLEVMDKKEPVNQFGEVVPFLWMGNMCCSNRKRLAVAKP